MAVNKVIFGNVTLIDTSEVTVAPDKMFAGETALGANGEMQTGTFTIANELAEQDALLTELETVLAGKAAGGGGNADSPFVKITIGMLDVPMCYLDAEMQMRIAGQNATVEAFGGLVWFVDGFNGLTCSGEYTTYYDFSPLEMYRIHEDSTIEYW